MNYTWFAILWSIIGSQVSNNFSTDADVNLGHPDGMVIDCYQETEVYFVAVRRRVNLIAAKLLGCSQHCSES